jgi:hypothetical protein
MDETNDSKPTEQSYSKSDVENIIKDRIAKVAKRANEAELTIKDLRAQMDKQAQSVGTVDMLTQQLAEMQQKLKSTEQRYARHTTISKHGLTSEIAEAVEWAFDKEMSTLKKSDRIGLSDWLKIHIEDPTGAPAILRPHLKGLQSEAPQQSQAPQQTETKTQYPNVNANARPSIPDGKDLITRAMTDPEFYKENREKVIQAYKNQRKTLRDR